MPRTWPLPPSSRPQLHARNRSLPPAQPRPPQPHDTSMKASAYPAAASNGLDCGFRRSSLKSARLWIQVDSGAAVSKVLHCRFRQIQAQQSQKCSTVDSGAAVSKVLDSGFREIQAQQSQKCSTVDSSRFRRSSLKGARL
eukprot:4804992-Pleurochrysis_carterae.AAC.1